MNKILVIIFMFCFNISKADQIVFTTDTTKIDVLKFYIQNLKINNWTDNQAHLIDLSEDKKFILNVPIKIKEGDYIKFTLGIDSITNTSGVMSGDLDPTTGMYWTWQSGYINFKLEGTSPKSPARNNEFTFHLGGYIYPNNSSQQVKLQVKENKPVIINFSIQNFLKNINLENINHVMSPGLQAVELSKKAAKSFFIK